MTEQVGRVLGGRYRLLAPLGAGSSAEVYLADDVRLRRQVAVKLLRTGLADDPSFLRRFRAEAQAAAALNHPHIVAVFDWSDEDDTPYLVTEYLSGGSLRSMLDAGHRLTQSQALVVGLEAAWALDHAHRQGFVHRDVKPANLLFGDDARLRIADFGLARAIAEAAWTEPQGAVLGTARYASPEQALGQSVDGRSDIYALALVMVEAVTGAVPFVADTTVATLMARVGRRLEVPEALDPLRPVLELAAHPNPADRLDADRFGRALMGAAEHLTRPMPLPLVGAAPIASASSGRDATLAGSAVSPTVVSPSPNGSPVAPPPPAGDTDQTAVIPARPAGQPGAGHGPPGDQGERDDTSPMASPTRAPRFAFPSLPRLGTRWPSRRWLRPALVVLAAVLLGVIGAVIVQQSRVPSHTVPPALIGSQQSQIAEHVGDFGWRIEIEERRQDDTEAGEIMGTDPEPGSSLREGGTLTVLVSLGPTLVDVPQGLEGRIQAEAEAQLTAEGTELVPEIVEEPSDEFAPGTVIRLEAVEERLPKGSTVRVVVSSGPPPITIPDLSGADLDDAINALETLGLEVRTEVDPEADGDDDEVVRTEPAANEQVAQGGTVTIFVAGEELVEVPDLAGKSLDDARDELQDADLKVGDVFGQRRGEVGFTNPLPGQEVPSGTRVDLFMI
jgi:serine/threonine-protein kinase